MINKEQQALRQIQTCAVLSSSSSIIQHGERKSTRKLGGRHPVKASREISEAIHVCKQVMVYSFPKPRFHCQTPPSFFSKNPTLLVSHRERITKNTVLSSHPVSNDNGSLDLNLETPFFNDDMQELNILGACINGVICLYDRHFLISNQRHVHCPSHVDYTYEGFGFGYDHKSNDYKVVRIVSFWDDSIVGPDRPPLVEVYTLSTDSWRQIDTVLYASILSDPCKSEIYLNGAYHWLAYRSEQPWPHGDTELIISFDMSNEVFQIIRMPELEDVSGMNLKTFSVLNDCLALIFL